MCTRIQNLNIYIISRSRSRSSYRILIYNMCTRAGVLVRVHVRIRLIYLDLARAIAHALACARQFRILIIDK